MGRLLVHACMALLSSGIVDPAFRPEKAYLALFTFQSAQWNQISADQLRILHGSPYDGMATWLCDAYSTVKPTEWPELQSRIKEWRKVTNKDLWPFVFLNRIVQQEPDVKVNFLNAMLTRLGIALANKQDSPTAAHPGVRPDPAFYPIKGMDLDNECGALEGLLFNWRQALRTAKALKSPGIGFDMEFYNNYPLGDVLTLAKRRAEQAEVTRQKLRFLGQKLADIVAEEYPAAVIWSLFTGLAPWQESNASIPAATSCAEGISEGILERAKQRRLRLVLIDGAENDVGYINRSLDYLRDKLLKQQSDKKGWTESYGHLELGATIAPWLDSKHKAAWMGDQPGLQGIEDFLPFFALLLQHRRFVWIYAASNAYEVWKEPYVSRFDATLRLAREEAKQGAQRPPH